MREIKFRAWDKREEDVYGDKNEPHYEYNVECTYDSSLGSDFGAVIFQEDITLEQYTGIHDKNGKEVYEGDIVRFKCWGHEYIDKVEYHKWGYYPIAPSKPEVSLSADGEIEIIGNIHENPELLER